MTKKLNDILNGVKSSKIETPDVSNIYQWNGKDGEKFVGKHKIEKHADRVGNGDDVYKGKTKKADYKRQSDGVYESIRYDSSKPDEKITHYNIVNNKTGKVVGKSKTKVGARKSIDNNDNKYGSYVHKAIAIYKEEVEKPKKVKVTQDGPDFYNSKTGDHIKSYKHLVKNDYDIEGAKKARSQFLKDHPNHIMEEVEDLEEISKEKLVRYMKANRAERKAEEDKNKKTQSFPDVIDGTKRPLPKKDKKRRIGMFTALDKIDGNAIVNAKEEVEDLEENMTSGEKTAFNMGKKHGESGVKKIDAEKSFGVYSKHYHQGYEVGEQSKAHSDWKEKRAAARQGRYYHEEVEDLEEKYEGFKKLKSELAAKGAKTPGALAAWIGRKKYDKEKFQKAAASDHKMKEDASCSSSDKEPRYKNKKMLLDKEVKESSCSTPSSMNKNPFSSTTGSNTGKETTPKKETATTPKSLYKIITKEDVENLDEISKKLTGNYIKKSAENYSSLSNVQNMARHNKKFSPNNKSEWEDEENWAKNKASKRLKGVKLAVDKVAGRSKVPATEEVEIQETAPPNPKIEKWIKANKGRFVKEYGKEKGMEVLYAKAWKMHNEQSGSPATTTDYAGPGAAGWTTGRMDTGTL